MMMGAWISANIIELFGAVAGIAYVILEIRRNILLWPLGIITSAVYIWVFGHNGLYANMGLQGYYLVISVYGWYKWHGAQSMEQSAVGSQQSAVSSQQSAVGMEHGAWGKGQGAWSREQSAVGSQQSAVGMEHGAWSMGHGAGSREQSAVGSQQSAVSSQQSAVSSQQSAVSSRQSDVRRIDGKTAAGCMAVALAIWGLLWFVLGRWTDSPVPLWDGLIASLSVVATWMLTRKYLEQWYVWIGANAIAFVVYLTMGMYPTTVLFFVYFVMAIVGVVAWGKGGPNVKK